MLFTFGIYNNCFFFLVKLLTLLLHVFMKLVNCTPECFYKFISLILSNCFVNFANALYEERTEDHNF